MAAEAACSECGKRIGVYEPVVLVDEAGRKRLSSLVREPKLGEGGGRLLHAECAVGVGDRDREARTA